MKDLPKQAVVASMVVAGLVALMAILDMVMGVPFSGSGNTFMMDIIFIISVSYTHLTLPTIYSV